MKRPYTESETNCCKKFNPDPWDQREVTLADKLFLHDTVRTLFHIPLNSDRSSAGDEGHRKT
jgi:hypothetical protein